MTVASWQVHVTWRAPAPAGMYTNANDPDAVVPTLEYAEVLGPYPSEHDARMARGVALAKRPGAVVEVIQVRLGDRTKK